MLGRLDVKQSWTVDKYDVPSGDLEFWARRRGMMPETANQNPQGFKRRHGIARLALWCVVVATCFAILIGFTLYSPTQSGKTAQGNPPAAAGAARDSSR